MIERTNTGRRELEAGPTNRRLRVDLHVPPLRFCNLVVSPLCEPHSKDIDRAVPSFESKQHPDSTKLPLIGIGRSRAFFGILVASRSRKHRTAPHRTALSLYGNLSALNSCLALLSEPPVVPAISAGIGAV